MAQLGTKADDWKDRHMQQDLEQATLSMRQHGGTRLTTSLRRFRQADADRFRAAGTWRASTYLDDFLNQVARVPDKRAITSYASGSPSPEHVTYRELDRAVTEYAAGLVELGVTPGDVVSIQMPNGWRGPAVALATLRVGAVPSPVPIIYRDREVGFAVAHAQAKVFVTTSTFRGFDHEQMGHRLAQDVPSLEHVLAWQAADPDLDLDARLRRPVTDDLLAELDRRRPSADDFAALIFTSGTTGVPKAVLHTHNTAWAGHTLVHLHTLGLTGSDVAFMASTIGHTTGFIDGMLTPLSLGQTVVYQDAWQPAAMLAAMEADGITWTLSATTFVLDLLDELGDRPTITSPFRAFACGGAAIPPGLAEQVNQRLQAALVPLWGCTETGIATMHDMSASVVELETSDGPVLPWIDLRVVAHDGSQAPPGEPGVIHVRGAGVLAGYLDQPDLNERASVPEGWFDTGDLGRGVDSGIRIVGRSKDIIVRGGQNIPPLEIENALQSSPAVRDVAVVPYPDDRLGERACAVVVTNGLPFTMDDMRTHLEQVGMAKQFWPERLIVTSSLPRTPSGKVQKFVVRDQVQSGQLT